MPVFKKPVFLIFSILIVLVSYSSIVFAGLPFDSKKSGWDITNDGKANITYKIPMLSEGCKITLLIAASKMATPVLSVPNVDGSFILKPGQKAVIMIDDETGEKGRDLSGIELEVVEASSIGSSIKKAEQKPATPTEEKQELAGSGSCSTSSPVSFAKLGRSKKNKQKTADENSNIELEEIKSLTEKNHDLKEFTQKLYELLKSANPERVTFARVEENRRLDALADLLVGDEVCAAVAFDDHGNLLIATNKQKHDKSVGHISSSLNFTVGVLNKTFYENLFSASEFSKYKAEKGYDMKELDKKFYGDCIVTAELEFDGRDEKKEQKEQIVHCVLIPIAIPLTKESEIREDNAFFFSEIHFFNDDMHEIDELSFTFEKPQSSNGNNATFIRPLPVPSQRFNGNNATFIRPLPVPSGTILQFLCPINEIKSRFLVSDYRQNVYLDPFVNRINTVIDYLSLVIRAAGCLDIQAVKGALLLHRKHLLKQTLIWEISRKYSKSKKGEKYSEKLKKYDMPDENQKEIDDFVSALCDNFSLFESSKGYETAHTINESVEKWWEKVIELIDKGIKIPKIISPENIKNGTIGDIIQQYFTNIKKLEAYVESYASRLGKLSAQATPFEQKEWIKVIDEDEDGIHAEVRILLHLLETNKKRLKYPYIATSKLCCCYCSLLMQQFGVQEISGKHGKAYPNWTLPKKFRENEGFMKEIFGSILHETYAKFKNESIKLSNGTDRNKAEVALIIFQKMAEFNDEDFKEIFGEKCEYKKLWPKGCDHRDDSDGEDDSNNEKEKDEEKSEGAQNDYLHDDLEKAKKESIKDAEKSGKIGPRSIPGWVLQDVADKGNCFYEAAVDQLKIINHAFIIGVPVGTLPHDSLRSRIQRAQGEEFADREWANDRATETLARELGVVVAIVDTTYRPDRRNYRFGYYYINAEGAFASAPDVATILPVRPVIRLAYTGNHYLSVIATPEDLSDPGLYVYSANNHTGQIESVSENAQLGTISIFNSGSAVFTESMCYSSLSFKQ